MAVGQCGYFLGSACGDDFSATTAAFGAEVDHPVCSFNDIEIVFDNDDRIAVITKGMEYLK